VSESRDLMPKFIDLMEIIEDDIKDNCTSEKYKNRVYSYFILLKDVFRFPTDDEFKNSLPIKDFYNSNIKKYVLTKIENHKNKEHIEDEDLSIEHILPQNEKVSDEWKIELGDNWENIKLKYLNTILNLTYTAYNSEMSDKPFKDKKEISFNDSKLKLNEFIKNQEKWNEDTMIKRQKYLFKLMNEIWAYPNLGKEILNEYKEEKIKKDNKYKLFELNNYDTHKDIFTEFVKQLKQKSNKIHEFKINKNYINYEDRFIIRFQKKSIKMECGEEEIFIKEKSDIDKSVDCILNDEESMALFPG